MGRRQPRSAKAAKRGPPGIPLRVKLVTWFFAILLSIALASGVVAMYVALRFGPPAVTMLVKRVVPFELPAWIPLP